jgi:hypothetical protein
VIEHKKIIFFFSFFFTFVQNERIVGMKKIDKNDYIAQVLCDGCIRNKKTFYIVDLDRGRNARICLVLFFDIAFKW